MPLTNSLVELAPFLSRYHEHRFQHLHCRSGIEIKAEATQATQWSEAGRVLYVKTVLKKVRIMAKAPAGTSKAAIYIRPLNRLPHWTVVSGALAKTASVAAHSTHCRSDTLTRLATMEGRRFRELSNFGKAPPDPSRRAVLYVERLQQLNQRFIGRKSMCYNQM